MALTVNGNRVGRAAQQDKADWINEQMNRAVNPSEKELELMDHEMDEAKEEKINESICATLAPKEYGRIREFQQIKREYRSALRRLVNKLESESVLGVDEESDAEHNLDVSCIANAGCN